jgi:hypothetical protein
MLSLMWHEVGKVPPASLVASRETLHHAAQLLALAGASYLPAERDDSHTSMTWREPMSAFVTEPITGASRIRFALRVVDLTLLVIDDPSGEERSAYPLHAKSRTQALDWMRDRAIDAGLQGGRLLSRLHFDIAAHPTDVGGLFERPTDGTLDELSSWYADASIVLEERRRAMSGAGAVRCWPHHFDIATLVRLPAGNTIETIGIGMSPGDSSYAEPYYYVSPYPAPGTIPDRLSAGRWHTMGWWGGALIGSEIATRRGAFDQGAFVRQFIDEALASLLGVAPRLPD